ncbi:hypothetical protein GCM10007382_16920 [Salinibacterium xinjiangense]|uniref:HKD family nuclease n=1 Tax=Salinibacterium xinjiangense TaxID=386302 RepID=A0A2C8YIB0_9MICO|nr:hypothetical protein [Salinibacterium xinjiangense]GGK97267.1 hypothetical protein GCM10007382_16920 [Salinibacterium xinjiangense]SOE50090.1 HKD family nuclease [Salinibacterium xinjiangense]
MAYEMSVHAQDPKVGRVGVVLDAIAHASKESGDYEHVDIAVAYASTKGVRLLKERLSSGAWTASTKRFLVSIDFGFTQPNALKALSELDNSEVRIPNARAVLDSSVLRPPSAFHAKIFMFGGEEWKDLRALIVGSANVTASALSTGAEVVTKQIWRNNSSRTVAWEHLKRAKPVVDWFEDTWDSADLLADVLDEYRQRYRALPKPRIPPEETTRTTRVFLASPTEHVITGILPVQLAAAKSLWVDGSSIIRNRKPRPGNQLNTPRGTRVFFGFDSRNVSKNTTLGYVEIRISGHDYVKKRSIRFADNGMDIIGLPIPERYGVGTYQDTILIFTRDPTHARFTLTVTDQAGLADRRAAAANNVELSMSHGRRYGLLF